jgi:hypothetical protein
MKKRLFHWKSVFFLSVILLIILLFQVLKNDFMALPDSGFSRGILLDQVDIPKGYDAYYSDYFVSLVKNNKLYLISSDEKGLTIKSFDSSAKQIDAFTLDEYKSYSKLKAHFEGNQIVLNTYNEKTRDLVSITIDLQKKQASVEHQIKLKDHRILTLAPQFVLYGTDDALILDTIAKKITLANPRYIETLAYTIDSNDNSIWIAYTDYVDSRYQLNLKHLDSNFKTLSNYPSLFNFNAGGATKPQELALQINGNQLNLLSVIKDNKAGVNTAYLLTAEKTNPAAITSKFFNAYTYSMQPTFYDTPKETQLIISTKTNIGRVEIGANGSFQNLVTLDLQLKEIKSLTKSTSVTLSPQMNEMGDYNYLCFLQINQGIGKIMLSSNHPEIIQLSKKSTIAENFNILMTSLTTFLPLSYISLIIEAYVLTPVMVVIILLSMFFLTWSERNGSKLIILAIGIHMIFKNLFIVNHMIHSSETLTHFPIFLNSPLKLLGWELLLTLSSLYCLWNYKKQHPHTHYLMQYLFFNLIDVTLFTMLFAPYYLLT